MNADEHGLKKEYWDTPVKCSRGAQVGSAFHRAAGADRAGGGTRTRLPCEAKLRHERAGKDGLTRINKNTIWLAFGDKEHISGLLSYVHKDVSPPQAVLYFCVTP